MREGHVAVEVGAVGPCAVVGEGLQCRTGRVAVGVARADRRDRDPGAHGVEERRILVVAAVVGHLQDVGTKVGAALQEVALRLRLDVAGQQEPGRPDVDAQDERGVVRVRPRTAVGPGRRQDLPPQRAGPADLPEPRPPDRHAHSRSGGADRLALLGRVVLRPDLHQSDPPAAEHAGEAQHVVGVQVGQDDDRHHLDAEASQAAVDRAGVRPGVDDHRGPVAGGERDGVALPDVADDGEPAGRRPGRLHGLQAARHDGGPRGAGQQDVPQPWDREGRHDHPRQRDQPERTRPAVRPRDRRPRYGGPGAGDQHQPGSRQPARPGEQLRDRQGDRRGDRRQDPRDGRGRHGRGGEQVRRDGEQSELGRQRHDDRAARHRRRGRDRQRGRQRHRQPAGERGGPRRCEHEQGRGRQHRQGEAGSTGQVRVDEHERDHG